MDTETRTRLIKLRKTIVEHFQFVNWEELGLITDASDIIDSHPRLLRSLGFGDDDYPANVLTVLRQIIQEDIHKLTIMEAYVDEHLLSGETYISAKPAERHITFSPHVFQVPDSYTELDLVAVMMPFAMEFNTVYKAIKEAASNCGLRCLRADDIWEESTIVQDIFNLIFRAQVIVVDFTGKNPNVMYETGIAHVLGKHVIPISQAVDDVPFDMRHHRVLKYLPNSEGLIKLSSDLATKLRTINTGRQALDNSGRVKTFSMKVPSTSRELPQSSGESKIALTFSEEGLVKTNEEDMQASLMEALFAADNHQPITFDVVLEPLTLVNGHLSYTGEMEATPANRIIAVNLQRLAKGLEEKRDLISRSLPMLLSPPLRHYFSSVAELEMSIDGIGRTVLTGNTANEYGLDVYRSDPKMKAVIFLNEDEAEEIEQKLGHHIFLMVGSGWDLYDLPRNTRFEKAIPALVLEVARNSQERGEAHDTLLDLSKWSIGMH